MNLYTSKTEPTAKQAFEAAKKGDEALVKHLIDHSFNVEDCDEEGNSILHYAVKGKNKYLVVFLVEKCGLDPAWANQNMVTPFDLAKGTPIEEYFKTVCGFGLEDSYRNPVQRGMHPDPSIVRVGEDYYMVNSSFIYFPSIPISHSNDLVHWKVIGYAVTDPKWAEENLGKLEGGRGFWAPDISYHNGRFYICATLRQNDDAPYIQTQMVTSSEFPQGPYEIPVIHNVLGIDPSIFTDDDGKRYMLVNRGARIMEISEDGKEILSEPSLIWYGHSGHAPEGPHVLKKDGYYYCFLAEGGTGKGHMITVGRSSDLFGPYEPCPFNPILHQKDEMAVIQCSGHGKPVQTPDGRWFIVYLCSRFIDGEWGMLGRETCLDEITWTLDGWPVINQGNGPSNMAPLPFPAKTTGDSNIQAREVWLTPRTRDEKRIREEEDGTIWIRGDKKDLCEKDCRSLLVKCQPDFQFDVEFVMNLPDEGKEEFTSDAGMTLYYDENTYIKFGVTKDEVFISEYMDNTYVRTEKKPFSFQGPVSFRVETDGLKRTFLLNNSFLWQWTDVTSICSEGLVKGKRFTGAMYGVYVNGSNLLRWRQHS
ncbi:family 43 glycosylhydrolase [Lacrimispora sp.]|uniref:family 43 glycosylhydrolase n=1 Tax=Lacrimispora sp. TaxID=2719234 RepID=UPI0028AAB892|nr:family 43 glycosylhydrolase [Lacrimispora sp.]